MNVINLVRKTISRATLCLASAEAAMRAVPLGGRVRLYALLCAAIAGTVSIVRGDWTQFRFDPAHHGVAPDETILSPANVATSA
jgi:hypothetical protein